MWMIFSTLLTALTVITLPGFYRAVLGRHIEYSLLNKDDKCRDEGVWILDGLIDCKYLRIKGQWGIDVEAKKRCTGDSLTNCCKTCKDLGFGRGFSGSKPETPSHTPQTAAPPPEVNITKAPPGGKTEGPADSTCKDNHVWILDMSVMCTYLEQPSVYGIHRNPAHYCTRDAQTDCCETCTRLGFTRGGGSNPEPVAAVGTDIAAAVATAKPKKAKSDTVLTL